MKQDLQEFINFDTMTKEQVVQLCNALFLLLQAGHTVQVSPLAPMPATIPYIGPSYIPNNGPQCPTYTELVTTTGYLQVTCSANDQK